MSKDLGFVGGKTPLSATGGLSGKAARALAKIKTETWKEMGVAFNAMAEFSKAGGMPAFMGGTIETIKSKIETSVTGLFAPVINEITQLAADVLVEFQPLIDDILGFISSLIEASKGLNFTVGKTSFSLWDAIMTGLGGLLTIIPTSLGLINDALEESERILAERRSGFSAEGIALREQLIQERRLGESF